ncbi:MAG: glycosyltransferase family 4 protein [Alphaproteobacteria bacterium]|nr:MAG: glycosyltransferase family 4 protein [Alphaproteobacteria bacterium]
MTAFRIWCDISELVFFFSRATRPTGVHRFALSLLHELRALPPELRDRVSLLLIRPMDGALQEVDWAFLDLMNVRMREGGGSARGMTIRSSDSGGSLAPPCHRSRSVWHDVQRTVYSLIPAALRPASRGLVVALVMFARAFSSWAAQQIRYMRTKIKNPGQVGGSAVSTDQSTDKGFAQRVRDMSRIAAPDSGDWILDFGATWNVPRHDDILAQARQKRGLRIACIIYDLIPIEHPDLVSLMFHQWFEDWLYGHAQLVDHMLPISQHTEKAALAYRQARGLPQIPSTVICGGSDFLPAQDAPMPEILAEKLVGPYVISVGTIEARKNQIMLFEVWKRLVARHGDRAPQLVLVGARGWGVDDMFARLESCNWLGGKVVWAQGADDLTLAALYRGCLFSMFPSQAEGWGLPVVEALAMGKLCLASTSTSIPEAGGAFADYFDPDSVTEALALVERYAFDDQARHQRENEISKGFEPRLWSAAAHDLMKALGVQAS